MKYENGKWRELTDEEEKRAAEIMDEFIHLGGISQVSGGPKRRLVRGADGELRYETLSADDPREPVGSFEVDVEKVGDTDGE